MVEYCGDLCSICAYGGLCSTKYYENNFTPASMAQLIDRLNNNKFSDDREKIIQTLKVTFYYNWKEK